MIVQRGRWRQKFKEWQSQGSDSSKAMMEDGADSATPASQGMPENFDTTATPKQHRKQNRSASLPSLGRVPLASADLTELPMPDLGPDPKQLPPLMHLDELRRKLEEAEKKAEAVQKEKDRLAAQVKQMDEDLLAAGEALYAVREERSTLHANLGDMRLDREQRLISAALAKQQYIQLAKEKNGASEHLSSLSRIVNRMDALLGSGEPGLSSEEAIEDSERAARGPQIEPPPTEDPPVKDPEKEAAALKIQCAARSRQARVEAANRRKSRRADEVHKEAHREEREALRAEKRREAEERKAREDAAAVKLQCAQRQRAARQRVSSLKKEREAARLAGLEATQAEDRKAKEEAAAVRIQCAQRQRVARHRIRSLKEKREELRLAESKAAEADASNDKEEVAALRIQCAQRQRVARQRVRSLKEAREAALPAELHATEEASTADEEAAAVRIQCAQRSRVARQRVRSLKEGREATLAAEPHATEGKEEHEKGEQQGDDDEERKAEHDKVEQEGDDDEEPAVERFDSPDTAEAKSKLEATEMYDDDAEQESPSKHDETQGYDDEEDEEEEYDDESEQESQSPTSAANSPAGKTKIGGVELEGDEQAKTVGVDDGEDATTPEATAETALEAASNAPPGTALDVALEAESAEEARQAEEEEDDEEEPAVERFDVPDFAEAQLPNAESTGDTQQEAEPDSTQTSESTTEENVEAGLGPESVAIEANTDASRLEEEMVRRRLEEEMQRKAEKEMAERVEKLVQQRLAEEEERKRKEKEQEEEVQRKVEELVQRRLREEEERRKRMEEEIQKRIDDEVQKRLAELGQAPAAILPEAEITAVPEAEVTAVPEAVYAELDASVNEGANASVLYPPTVLLVNKAEDDDDDVDSTTDEEDEVGTAKEKAKLSLVRMLAKTEPAHAEPTEEDREEARAALVTALLGDEETELEENEQTEEEDAGSPVVDDETKAIAREALATALLSQEEDAESVDDETKAIAREALATALLSQEEDAESVDDETKAIAREALATALLSQEDDAGLVDEETKSAARDALTKALFNEDANPEDTASESVDEATKDAAREALNRVLLGEEVPDPERLELTREASRLALEAALLDEAPPSTSGVVEEACLQLAEASVSGRLAAEMAQRPEDSLRQPPLPIDTTSPDSRVAALTPAHEEVLGRLAKATVSGHLVEALSEQTPKEEEEVLGRLAEASVSGHLVQALSEQTPKEEKVLGRLAEASVSGHLVQALSEQTPKEEEVHTEALGGTAVKEARFDETAKPTVPETDSEQHQTAKSSTPEEAHSPSKGESATQSTLRLKAKECLVKASADQTLAAALAARSQPTSEAKAAATPTKKNTPSLDVTTARELGRNALLQGFQSGSLQKALLRKAPVVDTPEASLPKGASCSEAETSKSREDAAAIKIQCAQRQRVARQTVRSLQKERDAEVNTTGELQAGEVDLGDLSAKSRVSFDGSASDTPSSIARRKTGLIEKQDIQINEDGENDDGNEELRSNLRSPGSCGSHGKVTFDGAASDSPSSITRRPTGFIKKQDVPVDENDGEESSQVQPQMRRQGSALRQPGRPSFNRTVSFDMSADQSTSSGISKREIAFVRKEDLPPDEEDEETKPEDFFQDDDTRNQHEGLEPPLPPLPPPPRDVEVESSKAKREAAALRIQCAQRQRMARQKARYLKRKRDAGPRLSGLETNEASPSPSPANRSSSRRSTVSRGKTAQFVGSDDDGHVSPTRKGSGFVRAIQLPPEEADDGEASS